MPHLLEVPLGVTLVFKQALFLSDRETVIIIVNYFYGFFHFFIFLH